VLGATALSESYYKTSVDCDRCELFVVIGVWDRTESVGQPLPVGIVDVRRFRRARTDDRSFSGASLAYRHHTQRIVRRLDCKHCWSCAHQVISWPQRSSVRHLRIMP